MGTAASQENDQLAYHLVVSKYSLESSLEICEQAVRAYIDEHEEVFGAIVVDIPICFLHAGQQDVDKYMENLSKELINALKKKHGWSCSIHNSETPGYSKLLVRPPLLLTGDEKHSSDVAVDL